MPKFQFGVTLNPYHINKTARVADGSGPANQLSTADDGKFARFVGDSQYGLCAVGNEIEGIIEVADDVALQDGFNLGSVRDAIGTRKKVTFDGLQATPGTGVVALGDYVVCGTVVPRGTRLTGHPRVCRATAAATGLVYKWRIVSFDGTGAVGQTGLIERVG